MLLLATFPADSGKAARAVASSDDGANFSDAGSASANGALFCADLSLKLVRNGMVFAGQGWDTERRRLIPSGALTDAITDFKEIACRF
jgi:hypothetical protein